MGDEIKIVILGDVGVGKTSLISTLVTEEFSPDPPRSLNRIGISNEVSSSCDVGLTYLIDYRSAESKFFDKFLIEFLVKKTRRKFYKTRTRCVCATPFATSIRSLTRAKSGSVTFDYRPSRVHL